MPFPSAHRDIPSRQTLASWEALGALVYLSMHWKRWGVGWGPICRHAWIAVSLAWAPAFPFVVPCAHELPSCSDINSAWALCVHASDPLAAFTLGIRWPSQAVDTALPRPFFQAMCRRRRSPCVSDLGSRRCRQPLMYWHDLCSMLANAVLLHAWMPYAQMHCVDRLCATFYVVRLHVIRNSRTPTCCLARGAIPSIFRQY